MKTTRISGRDPARDPRADAEHEQHRQRELDEREPPRERLHEHLGEDLVGADRAARPRRRRRASRSPPRPTRPRGRAARRRPPSRPTPSGIPPWPPSRRCCMLVGQVEVVLDRPVRARATPPRITPSAPTTMATIASVSDEESSWESSEARPVASARRRPRPRGGRRPRPTFSSVTPAPGARAPRRSRGLLDPAHDVSVAVGLERLEHDRVGLRQRAHRHGELLELPGVRSCRRVHVIFRYTPAASCH